MPTSEDLLFLVNANIVTNMIPVDSIEIKNERGNRVSMATFTIQNGTSLSLTRWQQVTIHSADMTSVHFNGFITDISTTRRGTAVDYQLTCSSVEILLQRSVIDGTLTGTDDVILADMLSNAYPDLSDFFDWSSGITPLSLSDLNIDFQDMNLLDGLNSLNEKAGGDGFSQDYNDSVRTNMIKNPALANNMNYFGADTPSEGHSSSGWNTANTTWGSNYGETGGGIRVVSLPIGSFGQEEGYWRIGRASDAVGINNTFHITRGDNKYLNLTLRISTTSAGTLPVRIIMVTYNEDGTYYGVVVGQDVFVGPAWDDWGASRSTGSGDFDLSDATRIPESGWCEFSCKIYDSSKVQFDTFIDSAHLEVQYSSPDPPASVPSYFDGSTANAYWLGTANASASAMGANPLTWGSNPDAAFDVDIDSGSEIFDDFSIDFNSMNSLGSVVVTGHSWEDVDWIYPNNGNAISVHFDLEVSIYPMESITHPVIYKNIGSDATPNWSAQTVATRQDGFGSGNVLYDLEKHWLEFQDAPPDLEQSFRVVGRIKKRIRTVVSNEELNDESAIELTDTLNIENIESPAEAYDLGQAELANREPVATVKFYTYEPGLNANDEIDIDDSLQDFSETLIVERVTRKYLGGGKGRFFVECGKLTAGLDDMIYNTNQSAGDKVPVAEDIIPVTVALLVDQDGAVLLDQDGNQLLDIV